MSNPRVWQTVPGELLTAVIPAHNRVRECLALLRYLRSCEFPHPVVVADSSQPERSKALQDEIGDLARYQYFGSQIGQYAKLAQIARCVNTPYIVVMPDDDIAFPHAIESSLTFLHGHDDHVAAHGYSLRFGLERGDFDIYQVEHFIPTIGDESPMQRYYHLMHRYQPHLWAVFRTDVYAEAMGAAASVQNTVFQEFMFQIVSVIAGKVARLPTIYAMRGMEAAQIDYSDADPLQWLVKDTASFFCRYAEFRNAVINYLRHRTTKPSLWMKLCHADAGVSRHGIQSFVNTPKMPFRQLIDMINAACLSRLIHSGTINYTALYGLGEHNDPVKFPGPWRGWAEPQPDDLIRQSRWDDRRYIWRRAVLEAEPRYEISITAEEMTKVEAELDFYEL